MAGGILTSSGAVGVPCGDTECRMSIPGFDRDVDPSVTNTHLDPAGLHVELWGLRL